MSQQITKTPVLADEKAEVIEHLNEEHQDDLLDFAQLYLHSIEGISNKAQADPAKEVIDAVEIVDIFHEGIDIIIKQAQYSDHSELPLMFITFPQPIQSLEELQLQYIALMQQSAKAQGKDTIKITEQSFELIDRYEINENMMRLLLTTENQSPNQPNHQAGYTYLFDCKSSEMTDNSPIATQRYYTVRKFWQDNHNKDGATTKMWVDVYLHGDTTGGNWARRLKPQDKIVSKREFPEKLEHLTTGQVLLIADETSMPTIARLLEVWQNPIAPIVISITNTPSDQSYLQNLDLSASATGVVILPMVIHHDQTHLADSISSLIDDFMATQNIKIHKIWGGLEARVVKKLRKKLSENLGIPRSDCILKVYWRR